MAEERPAKRRRTSDAAPDIHGDRSDNFYELLSSELKAAALPAEYNLSGLGRAVLGGVLLQDKALATRFVDLRRDTATRKEWVEQHMAKSSPMRPAFFKDAKIENAGRVARQDGPQTSIVRDAIVETRPISAAPDAPPTPAPDAEQKTRPEDHHNLIEKEVQLESYRSSLTNLGDTLLRGLLHKNKQLASFGMSKMTDCGSFPAVSIRGGRLD